MLRMSFSMVLHEIVYMEQPPGFVTLPNHVCFLQKSLYGLKQASRAWFEMFSTFLLEYGFFYSSTDPSLFIFKASTDIIILLLYVDDIILTGSSLLMINQLITSLSSVFHMKDLGDLHNFLGVKACYVADKLFLCQTKYALDLLDQAGMKDCKPLYTLVFEAYI